MLAQTKKDTIIVLSWFRVLHFYFQMKLTLPSPKIHLHTYVFGNARLPAPLVPISGKNLASSTKIIWKSWLLFFLDILQTNHFLSLVPVFCVVVCDPWILDESVQLFPSIQSLKIKTWNLKTCSNLFLFCLCLSLIFTSCCCSMRFLLSLTHLYRSRKRLKLSCFGNNIAIIRSRSLTCSEFGGKKITVLIYQQSLNWFLLSWFLPSSFRLLSSSSQTFLHASVNAGTTCCLAAGIMSFMGNSLENIKFVYYFEEFYFS